jgi:hypothetical protein
MCKEKEDCGNPKLILIAKEDCGNPKLTLIAKEKN